LRDEMKGRTWCRRYDGCDQGVILPRYLGHLKFCSRTTTAACGDSDEIYRNISSCNLLAPQAGSGHVKTTGLTKPNLYSTLVSRARWPHRTLCWGGQTMAHDPFLHISELHERFTRRRCTHSRLGQDATFLRGRNCTARTSGETEAGRRVRLAFYKCMINLEQQTADARFTQTSCHHSRQGGRGAQV